MMMKETRIIHRELLTTWWWRSAVQGDATDDFERGAARWSESRLTQRYSCRCILLQYHNECTVQYPMSMVVWTRLIGQKATKNNGFNTELSRVEGINYIRPLIIEWL